MWQILLFYTNLLLAIDTFSMYYYIIVVFLFDVFLIILTFKLLKYETRNFNKLMFHLPSEFSERTEHSSKVTSTVF